MSDVDLNGIVHRDVDVGEVRLHVACAGPEEGPLVVLLHGFPEFWWSWRHQIVALARAGYRVCAPDMRGYNLSDKPKPVSAYGMRHLTNDVAGLVRGMGRKNAFIVGHDWGAEVAWRFAMAHPDMTTRLAILNVPHPVMMMKGLRTRAQLKKSWYMGFFQLPFVPEKLLASGGMEGLERAFSADGWSHEEIAPYKEAFARRGALSGPLNYYRAAVRSVVTKSMPHAEVIHCPVLVLWGERDRFLGDELSEPPKKWVPNARVRKFPNATHWLQHDEPEAVTSELEAFFAEERAAFGSQRVRVSDQRG